MSKQRARRRAQREALAAQTAVLRARVQAQQARRQARREHWRLLRRWLLGPPNRRRAWLLGRRRPQQRLAAGLIGAGLLFAVWYFVDALPTRVALTLLLVIVLPVLVIILFPRKVN
jgi:Flp pilus assembly protein TadB